MVHVHIPNDDVFVSPFSDKEKETRWGDDYTGTCPCWLNNPKSYPHTHVVIETRKNWTFFRIDTFTYLEGEPAVIDEMKVSV